MSGPALKSLALYIWTRHRVLIVGTAVVYAIVTFSYDALWATEGKPFVGQMLTFLRAAPFFLPLLLCTSAVSVATADLATGESWYPKHFFRLPLGTRQLAVPFMVYTVGLYALLWIAGIAISDGRVLVLGPLDAPAEFQRTDAWEPFLPLAELVWIQALIWTPFRRRWARIAIMIGLVAAYLAALIFAIRSGVSDAVIIAGSLAQVPLAYAVAIRGIARARYGAAWQGAATRARVPRRRARQGTQHPFADGLAAQVWFESNVQRTRAGFVATFLVPLVLLSALLANLVAGREAVEAAGVAQRLVGLMMLVLGVVALASGPAFATFNVAVQSFKNEAFRMPSFFAALPLSTGQFAWAKLLTAAKRMSFVAAAVLAAAIAVFLITGMYERWASSFAAFRAARGDLEAGAIVALGAAAFLALTAAGTANFVWIGLLGRKWKLANVVIAAVLVAGVIVPGWVASSPSRVETAVNVVRTWLPVVAGMKVAGLALLIYLVGTRTLYSWQHVALIAAAWLAAVGTCYAAYVRYLPEGVAAAGVVLSTVVLVMPVLGIVGAPLALQWNRSR
jgi:hypothetical protein